SERYNRIARIAWIILPMKWLPYLLILLLVSTQVDDCWAVAPVLPSPPCAEDNEEYLPAQRPSRGEESSFQQKAVFLGLKPQFADSSSVRRALPVEWNLTAPYTPSPLYVFMSLQI